MRQALQAVRDFTFGVDRHGFLIIASFDESAFPALACLPLAGARARATTGPGEVFDVHDAVVAHQPGVLIYGDRRLVAKALEQRGSEHFPPTIGLEANEYGAFSLGTRNGVDLSGSLAATNEKLRFHLEGTMSPSEAGDMERGWQTAKGEIGQLSLSPAEAKELQRVADALELHHDGGNVVGNGELKEAVADQAHGLGAVAALVRVTVRNFFLDAMMEEARSSIIAIANDLREAKLSRPRLRSFPPVPKTIPKGATHTSTPADWKAWEALNFSIDGPQRYQYEIRAADGGLSADIIARGDLDGNGKASEFRLHVRIGAGGPVVVDFPIAEKNRRE
jgi:hypothetical protein